VALPPRTLTSTTKEPGAEIKDDDMVFLKSFAALIERLCKTMYHREPEALRSCANSRRSTF
jgi:hypothetical protein